MTAPIMAGAEPFSAAGGPVGALVLHGFTGNPYSMRPIAQRLSDAGFTVELPLLPGHGTSVEDLVPMRWDDWADAADHHYRDLAERCEQVAVIGLSMGGSLACWLAERHRRIAGLVVINPLVEPPEDSLRTVVSDLYQSGTVIAPGIGSDIAMPGVPELSYDGTPLAGVLSLFEAVEDLALRLSDIDCPVLLLSSRQDHVVPPSNGDLLVASVSGPIERVWLERSFHVATLDWDREEVESRTLAFVSSLPARARA